MARLEPLEFADLSADLKKFTEQTAEQMGFRPNDLLIMARNPALTSALGELVKVIYSPGALPMELKSMIALMSSSVNSPLFTAAERVALDVSRAASLTPNEVSDEMFDQLKVYYSENEIIEIVSVISLFGFLNRWNATFNTDIEDVPKSASLL